MRLIRPIVLLLAGALGALLFGAGPSSVFADPQRVGVVYHGGEFQLMLDGLRQGLRELGIEEGKHIVLDVRDAKGDLKVVEAAARELERAKVDAIVAISTSVSMAAKRATTQVPIVFFAGADPVAAGLVESYARPGGRFTGIHSQVRDLIAKRLEVLKQLMPKLTRAFTIYHPDNPSAQSTARLAREAAKRMNIQITERHARSIGEVRTIARDVKPGEFDAFFQIADAMITAQAPAIIESMREKRVATMLHETGLCDKGGLFCYGQSYREGGRLLAKFVQRILAGSPPKDLPVENHSKIDLVLNLRAAKHMGISIPRDMLLRADRVIE